MKKQYDASGLVSTIPEYKEYGLFIDLHNDDGLEQGTYLVSIGKDRNPKSVYQIVSCRKVNSVKHPHRFSLSVLKTPDMIPHATYSRMEGAKVKHIQACPIFWYSRSRK